MKKQHKRILALPLAAALAAALALPAFAGEELPPAPTPQAQDDVVVLYTNDVHNAYMRDDDEGRIGYAAVTGYKKALEAQGYTVTLVDGGDAIQGEAVGTLSQGEYLIDMMNAAGYDLMVPGNHEFDYGVPTYLDLAQNNAEFDTISCNFIDLKTGETVFDPYKIIDYGDYQVAYLGITTPETFTKSTPVYFQDENGQFIYGFCEGNNGQDLYDAVQAAIDAAKADGADYVIGVGHLGDDPSSAPWQSTDVIAHTTGFTAFLDGHSHSTIPSEEVTDAAGNAVPLCSTGTKLLKLGVLVLHADGTVETGLLDTTTLTADKDDATVAAAAQGIYDQFSALLNTVVAESAVDLYVNDPATGNRMVRSRETNMGDLCADSYRAVLGADVAIVNGGGIRVDLPAGEITYGDIIAVQPFGNEGAVIEATGQQILDALETCAAPLDLQGSESGGFLQVSGMSYEIDLTIPTGVQQDAQGMFLGVTGERRVKNVQINGVPIDPAATYTVAGHTYLLRNGGSGLTMLMECPEPTQTALLDNEIMIQYITDTLGGQVPAEGYSDPYGAGRITLLTTPATPEAAETPEAAAPEATASPAPDAPTATPNTTPVVIICVAILAALAGAGGYALWLRRKK